MNDPYIRKRDLNASVFLINFSIDREKKSNLYS